MRPKSVSFNYQNNLIKCSIKKSSTDIHLIILLLNSIVNYNTNVLNYFQKLSLQSD